MRHSGALTTSHRLVSAPALLLSTSSGLPALRGGSTPHLPCSPAPPGTERSSRCCVTSPRCRRRRSARSRPQRRASAPPSRTLPPRWAARTAGCETTCPCCRRGRRSSSRRRRGECRSPEVRVWARARDGAGRDELAYVAPSAPLYHPRQDAARHEQARAQGKALAHGHASRRIAGSGTHVLFVSYYVAAWGSRPHHIRAACCYLMARGCSADPAGSPRRARPLPADHQGDPLHADRLQGVHGGG